jgi:hypothetical protein
LEHPTLKEDKETVESSTWFTVNNNVFSTLRTIGIPCVGLVTPNNKKKTYLKLISYNKFRINYIEIIMSIS